LSRSSDWPDYAKYVLSEIVKQAVYTMATALRRGTPATLYTETTVPAGETRTVLSVSGKGDLITGWIWFSGAISHADDLVYMYIDDVLAIYSQWSVGVTIRVFPGSRSAIHIIHMKSDYTEGVAITDHPFTFDESLNVAYQNKTTEDVTVRAGAHYYLRE